MKRLWAIIQETNCTIRASVEFRGAKRNNGIGVTEKFLLEQWNNAFCGAE